MYIRQRGHAGLGKWYESLLNVVGEAGGAVAEAYGGKGAGAAVRGLHKGWTQAAFNRGNKGASPKGGPGAQPAPQQPGPYQYPPPGYYPPPQPPTQLAPAPRSAFGSISPTVLAIGAIVIVGGGVLLMRSKKS